MRYFGGKQRISKPLSKFLNEQLKDGQPFVDLFCGSCNVIVNIDGDRLKIANDKHKYLIAMWIELQKGWIPPQNLTLEEYQYINANKDEKPHLTGFVGFGCSFAGKWFGGYARTSGGRNENFCLSSHRSSISKINKMSDVSFNNDDYSNVNIPIGSLVYCDIPYKNTPTYCKNEVGEFDHDRFYQWVRDNSHKYDIYISEYKYNVPNDFEIVWEYKSKKEIRNKDNERETTVEVLMRYNGK